MISLNLYYVVPIFNALAPFDLSYVIHTRMNLSGKTNYNKSNQIKKS